MMVVSPDHVGYIIYVYYMYIYIMSITYVNISWYPHEYRPFLGPAKGEGRHQEYS
jgi:hypothetical protein